MLCPSKFTDCKVQARHVRGQTAGGTGTDGADEAPNHRLRHVSPGGAWVVVDAVSVVAYGEDVDAGHTLLCGRLIVLHHCGCYGNADFPDNAGLHCLIWLVWLL